MTTDNIYHSTYTLLGRWYDGSHTVSVTVAGNRARVESVVPADDRSSGDAWWAPGFFDTQLNGYAGLDYSGAEITPLDTETLIDRLYRSGTTQHCPTIITSSQERICRNLETIAAIAASSLRVDAAIPGIHIEGPYISEHDGPRGAHDRRYIRDPDPVELREWVAVGGGKLAVVTLAPERHGAIRAIEFLRSEGVRVAIGHTAADRDTIRRAVEAGATHSTHLGNGSHATIPRLHNYLWTQLADDRLTAGVIADGFHLPPDALRSFVRAKTPARIVAVSDAAPVAGYEPGAYRWGDIDVAVGADGHVSLAGTPFLAGAGHLLDRGIARLLSDTDMTVREAVDSCTRNAAAAVGRPRPSVDTLPSSDVTPTALTRFRWNGTDTNIDVTHTVVDGELVYCGHDATIERVEQ